MTSQDRPLTRRELRERERLLEQQAASASPQTDAPAPAFPVSPPPQAAPAFPPAQRSTDQRSTDQRSTDQRQTGSDAAEEPAAADTSAESSATPPAPAFAPRAAGSAASSGSPFAGPVATPVESSEESTDAKPAVAGPIDPSPFAPPATPQRWSRPPADDDDGTPERTLTRRELRALIDASRSVDETDETDETTDEAEAGTPAPARVVTPPQPVAMPFGDVQVGKPLGHWTSQLDLPDAQPEPFDQLLARGGGGAHGVPTTTSALILPSMPSAGGLGQPLPDGGEIMVTGSIDLPRSFGATGLHPSQLDSSDVDRLIDHIEDTGGAGAAPVSASRAVSTQGHPRDMIAPPKKEGVSAPLVLAVTAGVLALGVVASLLVGAMVGIF